MNREEGTENKLLYGNKDIGLQFTPNVIPVPPSGVGTSTLYIKATENATAEPHTFPIVANISFPTSIRIEEGRSSTIQRA
jgi:hypothetical protein